MDGQMRRATRSVTITEPMTLADLRWLVNECSGLSGDSKVSTKEHKSYNAMDWDEASITVHGETSPSSSTD